MKVTNKEITLALEHFVLSENGEGCEMQFDTGETGKLLTFDTGYVINYLFDKDGYDVDSLINNLPPRLGCVHGGMTGSLFGITTENMVSHGIGMKEARIIGRFVEHTKMLYLYLKDSGLYNDGGLTTLDMVPWIALPAKVKTLAKRLKRAY